MIALIALCALTVVFAVMVGFIALIIALTKAIVRGIRGPRGTNAPGALFVCQARTALPADGTDREFLRLMSAEWPASDH